MNWKSKRKPHCASQPKGLCPSGHPGIYRFDCPCWLFGNLEGMAQVFEVGQLVRTTQRFKGGSTLPAGTIGEVKEVLPGQVCVLFVKANELMLLPNEAVKPIS